MKNKAYATRIGVVLIVVFLCVVFPLLNAFHVAADDGFENPIIQNEEPAANEAEGEPEPPAPDEVSSNAQEPEAPAEDSSSDGSQVVPEEDSSHEEQIDESNSTSMPEDTEDVSSDIFEETPDEILEEELEEVEEEEDEDPLVLLPSPTGYLFRNTFLEPAHQKYITPVGDGSYNLTLEVTGNNQVEEHPANVVIILDVSASTTPLMLASFKSASRSLADILLTPENASLPPEKQVRIAIITFAETSYIHGTFTSDRSVFEAYINSIDSHDGEIRTNWQGALEHADNLLTAVTATYPTAKKYALFLTDGAPNIKSPEYINYVEAENRATNMIKGGTALYTIGVLDNNNQGAVLMPYVRVAAGEGIAFQPSDYTLTRTSGYDLATNTLTVRSYMFAGATSSAAGRYFIVDKDTDQQYINAFKKISAEISETTRYTNITITDTLSEYVTLLNEVDGTGTIQNCTVEKVFNNISTPINNCTVTYNDVTKQITFKIGEELDHQSIYRLTFQITPSQKAYDELSIARQTEQFTTYDGYLHIGDTSTGVTSENQYGYYSNTNATITFQTIKSSGSLNAMQTGTPFKQPVIQLELGSIHVTKIWKNDDPSDRPSYIDIILMQDGKIYAAIDVSASDDWEVTFNDIPGGPTGHVYTLMEIPTDNYEATYTPGEITYKGLSSRTLEFSIINTPDGTHTTDLSFVKTSAPYYLNGMPTNDPLSNAVFSLYVWTGTGTPSSTALVTPATIANGQWKLETTTTSMYNGQVYLSVLVKKDAYYQLVEDTAPANYQAPTGQWRFQLNGHNQIDINTIQVILGENGTTPPPFEVTDDGPFAGQLTLVNVPAYEMPAMGGIGTTVFFVGGVSLMSAAVLIYLHTNKKKKRINNLAHF